MSEPKTEYKNSLDLSHCYSYFEKIGVPLSRNHISTRNVQNQPFKASFLAEISLRRKFGIDLGKFFYNDNDEIILW